MEITKREILASISIIAIMILFGILISTKISEYQMDKNEIYNKAVKIEDQNMFQYGMDTNIGNAFVYGTLEAVDTVTYPEIDGKYMYISKVEEHYNRHTRTYTITNSKGHRQTRTKTYWSWDYAGEENLKCKEISFCDITFSSNKIRFPDCKYINTINNSGFVRHKYYGVNTKYEGTIFTELKYKTISDDSPFYDGITIEKTVDYLESGIPIILFWIVWIILIVIVVFGFYYLDNRWLE